MNVQKNIQRVWSVMAAGLLVLSLCVAMVGCGSTAGSTDSGARQSEQKADTTTTKKQGAQKAASKDDAADAEANKSDNENASKDVLNAVGSKEGSAYAVSLSNSLDGSISSLQLKASGETEYTQSMLDDGKQIAKGEVVRLYVPQGADGTQASYDVKVTLAADGAEGREVEFLAALAPDYDSVTLREADEVAFVEYTTKDQEEGSTKEAALARKAELEEQARLEQEEAAAAAAQQQTYVEPEPEATYEPAPEVTYEPEPEPEPQYYEEISAPVEAPAAPEQSSDGCVGDVVLR